MIFEKGVLIAAVVAGCSKLVAEVSPSFEMPAVGSIANLSATGAVIYLVLWTIPQLSKEFREELRLIRQDREDDRKTFKCNAKE